MATAAAPGNERVTNLDNLTSSRKEGWSDYIEAPKRGCPEVLSTARIGRLGDAAADLYDSDARTGTTTSAP